MNRSKFNEYDYINFLIATQKAYSCLEAERVQPESTDAAAHDAITRLLHRIEPSTDALWQEAQGQVGVETGILVIDDSRSGQVLCPEDGTCDTALVRQAWTSSAGHQLDYAVVE